MRSSSMLFVRNFVEKSDGVLRTWRKTAALADRSAMSASPEHLASGRCDGAGVACAWPAGGGRRSARVAGARAASRGAWSTFESRPSLCWRPTPTAVSKIAPDLDRTDVPSRIRISLTRGDGLSSMDGGSRESGARTAQAKAPCWKSWRKPL